MINNIYDLEREVTYNNFIQNTMSIDPTKVLEGFKVLLTELKQMQNFSSAYHADMMLLKGTILSLETDNKIYKDIIRKMGKDYPEIVLSYPHFFEDTKNVV